MAHLLRSAANYALRTFLPEKFKEKHELSFWHKKLREEDGRLVNRHYQRFYTEFFGLSPEFYAGKRIVDIGCGPRGSLEWADMAAERVGIDSLAKEYLKLNGGRHKMRYVDAGAEAMPFESAHFDVACSFNSLDHVDDLGRALAEIKRIVKPGGLFLLITEVNHAATPTEPQCFSFDIVDKFKPEFTIVSMRRFEMAGNVYDSLGRGVPYDEADKTHRDALLAAMFERNDAHANWDVH
ncbi:MAG TPA: class I SAM-dependent methyltransferase [Dongiaceae bacterium]|nr:class I SAM-dependent methyltransferase [Dongiaceae bacterium]